MRPSKRRNKEGRCNVILVGKTRLDKILFFTVVLSGGGGALSSWGKGKEGKVKDQFESESRSSGQKEVNSG